MRFPRLSALRNSLKKRRKIVVPVAVATLATMFFIVAAPSNAAPAGTLALVPATEYSCEGASAWGTNSSEACDTDAATEPPATRWIAEGYGSDVKITFTKPTYLAGIGFRGGADDNVGVVANRRITGGTLVGCNDAQFTSCDATNLTFDNWDNIGSGVSFGEYGAHSFTPPTKAYTYYKFKVTRTYGDTAGVTPTPANYGCPDNGVNGRCIQVSTIFFFKKNYVTFDKNTGTGTAMADQLGITSTALSANTYGAPTGHTFAGWNTAANGSGTWYAAGANYDFAANTGQTLYAQWMMLSSANQTASQNRAFTSYTPTLEGTFTTGSFSASNLPAGLSINSSTGAITGTPTGYGTNAVTVSYTSPSPASVSTSTTFNIVVARERAITFKTVGNVTLSQDTYIEGQAYTMPTATADDATSKFAGWNASTTLTTGFYNAGSSLTGQTGDLTFYERRVNEPSTDFTVAVSGGATTTVSSSHETINITEPQTAVLTRIGTVSDGGTLTHVWKTGQVTGTGFITSDEVSNPDGTLSIDWRTNRYLVEVTNTLNGVSISALSSHAMIATSQPIVFPSVSNGAGNYQTAGTQVAAPAVTGGRAPFTFSITTGTLPAGLTLNTSTGEISGTPTTVATTSGLVMRARDANGSTELSNSFNIVVSKQLLATPATPTVVQLSNLQLKVNFTAVTNAASYIVQLFSDSAGTTLVNQYTGFTVGGANTFSGLTPATTYYAKVIAVPAASSTIYTNSAGSALGAGTTDRDSFNITWDLQGGTLTGSTPQATFSYASPTINRPLTNPTKAGYQFKGWGRASNSTFDQIVIKDSGSPSYSSPTDRTDITLYAVWAEDPTMSITYQVGSSTPVTVSRTSQSIPISLVVGTALSFNFTGTVSSNGTISYRYWWFGISTGGSTNSFTRTPSTAGSWTLRVYAKNTDAFTGTNGQEVAQDFEVRAVDPLTVSYSNPSLTVNSQMSSLLPVTAGGQSSYSYAIKSGVVPAGVTFSTVNGMFYGTPTTVGASTLTVEATDSLGFKATSQPFTINVAPIARTLSLTSPSATAAYLTHVQLNTPTQNPTNKGGAISYSAGSSTACSVNSTGLVSITSGTGTCAVTSTIAANGNYAEATSAAVTLTPSKINQANLGLTLSPSSSMSNGSSFSQLFSVSSTGGTTGGAITLTVFDDTASGCQLSSNTSPTTLTATSSGICRVKGTMAGNDNYLSADSSLKVFTFSKKALAIPANLQVSPVAGYTDRVSIQFDSSSDATAYSVQYVQASAVDWSGQSQVNTYLAGQTNILSGLTPGTAYKFRVYARQTTNSTYIEAASTAGAIVTATTFTATPTPAVISASGTLAKTYGQSLSLTADVSAGTSLSYQWKKDGVAISGATSATYSINSLVLGDAGAYTCDITDTANGITSATATYSAQTVTVSAATLATPSAPTVTNAASGTGLNASWVAVPGATSYVVRIYEETSSTELGPAKTITSGTTAQFMYSYPTYYIRNSKLYRITVQAIGDGVNYLDSAASTAGTATTVPPASIPTFTDIQSVSQPIGSTVEFTVNDAVSPDGGAITYYWNIQTSTGSNVTFPSNVSGQRTKTLKITGVTMAQSGYRISATVSNEYLGNFRTKSTTVAILTVTKNTQTITFGSLASKDLTSADFNVSATATSAQAVSFSATTAGTCSVTGSTVHIIAAGTCTIAADQAGTSDYEAAPQVTRSFTITAASQTITFGALSDRSYSATPFTVSASSSAGLTVSFASATPSVCTVSGTSVTMVSTGDCTINADQAGDAIYAAATQVARTFAVTAASISSPVAPTLSATAGVLKSIEVSWSAITNSDGYLLKLYNNAGTNVLATISVGSTTSTTLDATDYASIADDTPYKVSIIAVGATNYANSAESATAGVTTNKSYSITYRSTGATAGNPPAAGSYITGAAASSIAQNTGTLARTGYTFAGWNTLAAGNGTNYTANGTGTYSTTEDVELHPVWTPNPVTVTFNSNFGTPTTTTQAFIADAAENLDANTFVNPGYTFIGWATSAQGQAGYNNGQSYTTLVPITFYAKWQAIDYAVEYRLNNGTGTAPTEADQNIGDVITMKPITGISRTGYDFMGWSDGTTTYAVNAPYTIGTTNVVLTAQWQIQTYTITYDVNNGSGTPTRTTDTFIYGSNAIALPSVGTMTRTGYSFAGWSTAANGSSIVGNYTATASVTLYARWSANTYTVTYNSNGAQGALAVEADSYTTAATVITLPGAGTMTRDGYTFGGWSETVAGSAIGTATYTTTLNRTLYAVWNLIDYNFTFTTAHGSTPATITKNIGQRFTLPTLTAAGYYFAGWKVGSQTFDAGYSYPVETSDVAFTATWIQIFDVHYNFNGANESAPADNPQLDGAVLAALAAPTKDGYNFAGWRAQNNDLIPAEANFTVRNNRFVLSATWTAIDYPITYAAVGGTPQPSSTTKNYGEFFTIASAPTKAGHSFNGWNDGTNTLGAGFSYQVQLAPVNLTAQWTAINYHVTYDINQGSSITPVMSDKTIGQYFTVAGTPVRFGYTFMGWSDGTNTYAAGDTYTVAAANVTLTAQWSATALTMAYQLNGPQGSIAPVIKYIGDVLVLEAAPTWADHTFLGWNDGTTTYNANANYLVTGSPATFTARWENVLYGATYLDGGATGNAPTGIDLAMGTNFILPTQGQLVKAGYTFAGWSDGTTTYQVGNSYVMPSPGVTFTAQWTLIPVVTPPSNNGGSGGGSGTTPTTPVEKPAVKIVYGTSKTLAKAAEILGTPVTWVSENANCKVTNKGVVTPIAVGPCEIRAINKNTLAIANVFKLVVEPRLKISLKNVSKLKPTSARLNASVVYPGSDFTAKFCVTTALISTDCKFLSSITVSNESSNITSKSAVSVTRDIQGLKPGTTYFVHAAVVVGTKQYQTAPQLLKTPKVKKPVVKPETEPEVTPGPSAPRDKPARLWFTVDEPWFGRSL